MAINAIVRVPSETITDDTVLVGTIFVSSGSPVERGSVICEIETAKSIVVIESPSSGYLELRCAEDQELRTGDVLAVIHDSAAFGQVSQGLTGTPETADRGPASAGSGTPATATPEGPVGRSEPQFSDDARAAMLQFGLSPDLFGDRAFVRKKDVLDHLGAGRAADRDRPAETVKERIPENTEIVPVQPRKAAEIRSLQGGQNGLTSMFVSKVRLPAAVLGNKERTVFKNLRNSLTALIVLQTGRLLKKYRELNAFYHNEAVHYYRDVAIGYAIDLGRGLRVASLGNVEGKTTDEISERVIELVRGYLQEGLGIKDLQGSTFTISDLSSEDVHCFSPLINRFQSAILGISSLDEQDGVFLLSLVFDHRVTEGKQAAQFLRELKKAVVEELSKG